MVCQAGLLLLSKSERCSQLAEELWFFLNALSEVESIRLDDRLVDPYLLLSLLGSCSTEVKDLHVIHSCAL